MSSEQTTPTPETDAVVFEADTKIDHRLECVTADHARSLERRLAAAQAELDGYKADRIAINARNAELYAECERLRDGAAMLDWMIANHAAVRKFSHGGFCCGFVPNDCDDDEEDDIGKHATPRDAIRAAMQSEQGAQG